MLEDRAQFLGLIIAMKWQWSVRLVGKYCSDYMHSVHLFHWLQLLVFVARFLVKFLPCYHRKPLLWMFVKHQLLFLLFFVWLIGINVVEELSLLRHSHVGLFHY